MANLTIDERLTELSLKAVEFYTQKIEHLLDGKMNTGIELEWISADPKYRLFDHDKY